MLQSVITYFETIPSWQRALLLASGIMLFWIIEGVMPLKKMLYAKVKHAGVNLFFTLTTIIVNFALAFMMSISSQLATNHSFGLYNWLPLPLWLNVVIGIMVLDGIGAYLIHYLQHKVKFMWVFHVVHHSDTAVDTTTANRHHPGESVFRATFTSIAILIAGAPFGVVMLYQSLSALFSQFNHANIKLPLWLDNAISYIIVSPNMHKVHHHYTQPYTDTNYGNIFSLWDRLAKTFAKKDNDTIVYGIDTHMLPEENSQINNLLKIPFQPYREPKINQ
jgi:sterol desaturase/sphingolipid hydroxylase (fatty acid hydroxylase superfamily)